MAIIDAMKSPPALWIFVTVACAVAAYAAKRPVMCKDVEACEEVHSTIPSGINLHVAWGLSTVLIMEGASLFSTWIGVMGTSAVVPEMKNRCIPSLLLVIVFTVLVGQHFTFAFGEQAWYAHAMVSPGNDLHARPIYTITYLEWLIIVPILLTLAGHCALGRPLTDLTRPVVLTNVYIVISWWALLVEDDMIRWSAIAVTFTMYGIASFDMFRWVEAFFEEMPKDTPNRGLRPCLTVGLIALFAAYGVIYLFGTAGVLSVRTERWCYLGCDVSAKLAITVAFVVIRTREYHKVLDGLLSKVSSSNMGLVSILRGSFDYVLPCTVDATGRCQLPMDSHDLAPLSQALGSELHGVDLGSLLVGYQEQAAFRSYVSNTIAQASRLQDERTATMSTSGTWQTPGAASPPIAQVLHCSLHVKTADMEAAGKVRCAIHLSVVPQFAWISAENWQVIAALRLLELPVPEATGISTIYETTKDDASTAPSSSEHSDPCQALVASLQDIARLGISSMLQSQKGGTTVISATETVHSNANAPAAQPTMQLQQQQQPQQQQQQYSQKQPLQQQQQVVTLARKQSQPLAVRHKCPSVEEEVEEEDCDDVDKHSRVSDIVELVSGASFSRETSEEPQWLKEMSCESASTRCPARVDSELQKVEQDVFGNSGRQRAPGGTPEPTAATDMPRQTSQGTSSVGGKVGRSSSHRSSNSNSTACSTRVPTKTGSSSTSVAAGSGKGRTEGPALEEVPKARKEDGGVEEGEPKQQQKSEQGPPPEAPKHRTSSSKGGQSPSRQRQEQQQQQQHQHRNPHTGSDCSSNSTAASGHGEIHLRKGKRLTHDQDSDRYGVLVGRHSQLATAVGVGLAAVTLIGFRLKQRSL